MRKIISIMSIMVMFLFAIILPALAQEVQPAEVAATTVDFGSFAGIVAFVSIVATQMCKKWKKIDESQLWKRVISVVIGIAAVMSCWYFQFTPLFEGLVWWRALIYGAVAGLASTGLYGTIRELWRVIFPNDKIVK